jgi:hypothetical protein
MRTLILSMTLASAAFAGDTNGFIPFITPPVRPLTNAPALIPASKAGMVTNGITLGQVVKNLGPGIVPAWSGTGDLTWSFSDGRTLYVQHCTDPSTVLSSESDARHRFWFIPDPTAPRTERRPNPQGGAAFVGGQQSATTTNAQPDLASFGFFYIETSPELQKTLDISLTALKLERKMENACATVEDARALIWRSINIPTGSTRACTEYKGFFWFSRLDWAGQDDRTFKSGFAVKKGTGEIYRWEDHKARTNGASNRRQPVGPETNRAPRAVGSGG